MLIRLTSAHPKSNKFKFKFCFTFLSCRASKCHQTECGATVIRPGSMRATIPNGWHCCEWGAIVRWWHLRTRHMRRGFGQFANEGGVECLGRRWHCVVWTWMRSAGLASRLHESVRLRSMDSLPLETVNQRIRIKKENHRILHCRQIEFCDYILTSFRHLTNSASAITLHQIQTSICRALKRELHRESFVSLCLHIACFSPPFNSTASFRIWCCIFVFIAFVIRLTVSITGIV